ncbi:MAG: phosphate ABC transporter ATP-binding protein [Anaerolineaceae bacterium]|nr:MAG: phosphate ABC transporter ATP-binding protein [Anaerolineaceae bacterium]
MYDPHIRINKWNVWYGSDHALVNITADIPAKGITTIIGPSGCGKTTLLKSMNRLLDEMAGTRVKGQVWLDGINIYDPGVDVTEVRTRVGFLAPKPFPLPMSIYDNVAYGPRIHRHTLNSRGGNDHDLDGIVENNLRAAGLWEEVKDRLRTSATRLSTGQQQRLCLARALAVEPDVLLCDEPTSALDPIAAQKIEAQLQALKKERTIVVVTHMLRQARRMADYVILLWMGELVETGPAMQVFVNPRDERTRAYLDGDIG